MAVFEERLRDLAIALATGLITLAEWQQQTKDDLHNLYALQLLAATDGNPDELTDEDWATIEPALQSQYSYLAEFAAAIVAGMSAAELAARAALYPRASQSAYYGKVYADYSLPAQPGEGTFCRCGCQWRIEEHDDGSVDAYWERSLEDSCSVCIQRERDWNPYHISAQDRGA